MEENNDKHEENLATDHQDTQDQAQENQENVSQQLTAEELLAAASDCLDAPSAIHNILTNADMTFEKIEDEEGNKVELTEGNYSSFIRSKNRKEGLHT